MANEIDAMTMADTARLWVIRLRDPDFADWDGFIGWLETDQAHVIAYEAELDADEAIGAVFAQAPRPSLTLVEEPVPVPAPVRRRWRNGVAGGAVAAALLAVAGWSWIDRTPAAQEIATRAGEHRTVTLPDGSVLALNGSTRVRIPEEPRRAELLEGEALFQIKHDASDPFMVTAGSERLVDAGTVFNVVRASGETRIAVAQGAVIFRPGPEQVRLGAGDALRVRERGLPMLSAVAPDQVGRWRNNELVYRDAPLEDIAEDLQRGLGVPVQASGFSTRFTGALNVQGKPDDVIARIAPLLGVRAIKGAHGWQLTPVHGASR